MMTVFIQMCAFFSALAPTISDDPPCWKPLGTVHCQNDHPGQPGTGIPLTITDCSQGAPAGGPPFRQCDGNGKCPNPYFEQYSADPWLNEKLVDAGDDPGKRGQGTADKLCVIRRECGCTVPYPPQFPNGFCMATGIPYEGDPNKPSDQKRAHPIPVGADCNLIPIPQGG
jgi:hypothetical protein